MADDTPDFAEVAPKAKPISAGCCDCDAGGDWIGDDAREKARAHAMESGHFIWVEGVPTG
jgi:hypothetical protein